MSDIASRRTVKPTQYGRFERQQGEDVINVAAHGTRAPRPPCPDRRTNIVDDRNFRRPLADTACNAMRKLGAVDDDDNVRVRRNRRVGGLTNPPQNFRQSCRNRGKAHDGQFAKRKKTREPLLRHVASTNAGKSHEPSCLCFERVHERRAKTISRLFPGCQKNVQPPACSRTHRVVPGFMPTTKISARSAAAPTSAGSATIVSPAIIASPARPAFTT